MQLINFKEALALIVFAMTSVGGKSVTDTTASTTEVPSMVTSRASHAAYNFFGNTRNVIIVSVCGGVFVMALGIFIAVVAIKKCRRREVLCFKSGSDEGTTSNRFPDHDKQMQVSYIELPGFVFSDSPAFVASENTRLELSFQQLC